MNIVKRLNGLAKKVDANHPYINWGGCCVFAAKVAAKLEPYVDRVAIKVGQEPDEFCDGQHLDDFRKNLRLNTTGAWNAAGLYFAHIIIEFDYKGKTYHYDSNGVKPPAPRTYMGAYPIVAGSLGIQEATALANRRQGWNPSFDRKEIPHIDLLINNTFDKIEKQRLSA